MRELGLLVLTLSVLSTPVLQSSAPDCYAAQGDKVCIVTGSTLHIFGDCGAKAMDSVDLTSSTSDSRVCVFLSCGVVRLTRAFFTSLRQLRPLGLIA